MVTYNINRGHAFRIAFGITMLASLLAGGAGATTNVSACTTISSPGEYVLNTNIINSGAPSCINITSSDVVFDGAGYTIDGSDWIGVFVSNVSTVLTNVTVTNLTATDGSIGIYYNKTTNGNLTGNNANSNTNGIFLDSSSNNILSGNIASNNNYGIVLLRSSNNNTLSSNTISNSSDGIYLSYSSNNGIYQNNVINNTNQAYCYFGTNLWDNGYPSGGNYWSDYTGIDANADGVGDTPYNIGGNAGAQDRYPLMKPWGSRPAPAPTPMLAPTPAPTPTPTVAYADGTSSTMSPGYQEQRNETNMSKKTSNNQLMSSSLTIFLLVWALLGTAVNSGLLFKLRKTMKGSGHNS